MSGSASDVCVVGGGVVGLAVAASLLDRDVGVVCLERGVPGEGQSAGRTRQFRHLHREPELIELAVRARSGWLEWERRFGRTLLGQEGALRFGAESAELEALRAAGVPAAELDRDAAIELFPIARRGGGLAPVDGGWAPVDAWASDGAGARLGGRMILWDPLAGAIRAADAIAALADRIGPSLRQAAEVHSIQIRSGGEAVEVRTSASVHHCARCVVCAGAGTDRLVRGLGLSVHQDRQAHLRLAFRIRAPAAEPPPCLSDRSGEARDFVYGLSDLGDRYAVGLATVTTYPAVEDLAADVPPGVDLSAQRKRIVEYVRLALPGLDPRPVDEVLRLTTTLPEHPEDGFSIYREGPVLAIAGPNLFKFAPVIGARLAEAVITDGEVEPLAAPTGEARAG